MAINVINTKAAPAPIGPYSQGIVHGNTFYPAGQIGLNPETGNLEEGIEAQARRAFANLKVLCEAAGSDLSHVVKVAVLITDMADFPIVNAVMSEVLSAPFPARTCYAAAALPKGALVEIDATVALP